MTTLSESAEQLATVLAQFALALPPEQIELLDRYRSLLWEWNAKLNLTRHTDFEKFVTRDVVDSLALERLLDVGEQVIDLGTGGGVPGIILAIVRPDLDVTLTESVGKKARVVEQIVRDLGLTVAVHPGRAEELLAQRHYDTVVARAVAPLYKLIGWLDPHWDMLDRLLVIKGRNWETERGEARHRGLLKEVEVRLVSNYTTPGTDAQSVVLRVRSRDR